VATRQFPEYAACGRRFNRSRTASEWWLPIEIWAAEQECGRTRCRPVLIASKEGSRVVSSPSSSWLSVEPVPLSTLGRRWTVDTPRQAGGTTASTPWSSTGETLLISTPPETADKGACIPRRYLELEADVKRPARDRECQVGGTREVATLAVHITLCLPCSVFVPRASAIPGNSTTPHDRFESGPEQVKRAFPQIGGWWRSALTTQGSAVRTRHRPPRKTPGQRGFPQSNDVRTDLCLLRVPHMFRELKIPCSAENAVVIGLMD
jgi:hypothetical protein